MRRIDISKFLEDTTGRYARAFTAALIDMVVARTRQLQGVIGAEQQYRAAEDRFAEVQRQTMGVAELAGALSVLHEAAVLKEPRKLFREPTQTLLPSVTFEEALENIVARTPVTIRDAAQRTAQAISELYRPGMTNIAFVKAAEDAVTQKAQSVIANAVRQGVSEDEAGRRISMSVNQIREESEEWSESYARLTFRNNVNRAASDGRFRQAQDPDIMQVIPAMMKTTAGDGDVRDNHAMLDGLVMLSSNPDWQRIRGLLGHNCRCREVLMSLPQLRRMGRLNEDGSVKEDKIPANWPGKDDGFK